MQILLSWLLYSVAIILSAYLLPGVEIGGFGAALGAALILGLLNAVLRPLLLLVSLPVNVLTLGLFTFVINAGLVMLAASIVPGFQVGGFWIALIFALILSLISSALSQVIKD